MLHLIAEIKANPGCEIELKTLLQGLLEPTREEEGCCQYELFTDQKIPGLFIMQEIWCSQASLDRHLANEHLTHFNQQVQERQLLEYVQLRPLQFVG